MTAAHRPARLRDVASRADVSVKTASRVINGGWRVAPDTRERVERAISELGYRPDLLARSLRRGRDEAIGVVVESIADPFFAALTGAIEQVALERGVMVVVASTGRQAERERTVLEELMQRRVSGMIVVPVSGDHADLAGAIARTPLVFVDRRPRNLSADTVVVDDVAGARAGVEHLLAHGHRRIALLSDSLTVETSRLRRQGYLDALAAAGPPALPELMLTGLADEAASRAGAERLLDMEDPPTAVFTSNIRCSLGVVPVLHARDRTDVAMVGFGNFSMAESLRPAVTVIDHDPGAIGRVAATRLFQRLDGDGSDPSTTVLPVHLVARGSGELAPPVRDVAGAA